MILARLACAAALSACLAVPATAAETHDYTKAAFEAAQKAGRPILVEVHASWCPTCKAQLPILSRLEADPKFRDLQVFRVDFDAQKDVVRLFGARLQSTLVTFKGATETGRSVGDTDPASIATLLDKAI